MAWVSDTVFSLLVLATGGLTATTVAFAVAWLRARERAIRAEERAAPVRDDGDARVDRVEQALEAIADDVARMAEGQQFVSRLLAERPAPSRDAGARPAHVTAPA